MTSPFCTNEFPIRCGCSLCSSAPRAVSVLPAQSRLKMNGDVIAVIFFKKSFSGNFFLRPHRWKVIRRLVCGSEDRMDERRVSLGRCLCFKAVWETARGEEFISSSEQSRAKTIQDLWEEFKGIISKELEDDSHRWDSASQILRRYWGELISRRRAESLFSGGDSIEFRVNKLIAAVRLKQRTASRVCGCA